MLDKSDTSVHEEQEIKYSLQYLFDKHTNIDSVNDRNQKGYILLPDNPSGKKFPVLYLIHGLGGYEEWRAKDDGNIVDNINEWQKNSHFEPMIFVMPNIKYYKYSLSIKNFQAFHEFIPNLVEEVNSHYSDIVLFGCNHTAIAGFSLGGAAALYYSILYKDMFIHTGAFSPSACLYYKDDPNGGWIKSDKDFVLNNDVNSVQFIGYGEKDIKTIKPASNDIISLFNSNYGKCPDKYPVEFMNKYIPGEKGKTVLGGGHCFFTFNELLCRFLSVNIFGEHKVYQK